MKNRQFEIGDNLMIVIIALIIMMALIFSCSSYEVVKKTSHPRYESTKERHGGGKTTLE